MDTDQAISDIKENGFAILRGLLSPPEIGEVQDQLSGVMDAALTATGATEMLGKSIDEKYNFLEDTHPKLKSHCYDVFGMVDAVARHAHSLDVIEVARRYFDATIVPCNYQIRIDTPRNRRNLPLHQELGQMSELNLTMWLPLVDVNAEAGGLRYVPGSHKRGLAPHYYKDVEGIGQVYVLREETYENDEVLTLDMKAGDALLFHTHLFHGTAANNGSRIRWTIVSRYNEISTMPYLSSEKSPLQLPPEYGAENASPAITG